MLAALVAPLLDFLGLEFGGPLVTLVAFNAEARFVLYVLEESDSAIVCPNTRLCSLEYQVAVVAEAHLAHLVEVLIATIASDLLRSCLHISLPTRLLINLTNSGELLLNLMLLIITISVFIFLFLVGGVHLRRSGSHG